MLPFVDEQVQDNCWNLYDSFGEICVHCGCCSKDKKTRYAARVECLERWQAENERFDEFDDDPVLCRVQMHNKAANARHYRRQLWYYRKKLQEVMNA